MIVLCNHIVGKIFWEVFCKSNFLKKLNDRLVTSFWGRGYHIISISHLTGEREGGRERESE